ncbi:hypothetical protein TrLO_g14605 [Triparma laevis f. longispina]|uniref:Uncharacterized protein n=1 Tax=Triparma laevis f. longispina TaxID=1714387 RepID=A0A9W7E6G6_9STRA|nr:hypothetical protein TrLO_g14605 [Triparma laevis f. longispina]
MDTFRSSRSFDNSFFCCFYERPSKLPPAFPLPCCGLGLIRARFECVKTILRQTDPYHVFFCSHSVTTCEKAVASLPSSLSPSSRVSVIELDVTSSASITAAVASAKSLTPSLSVLVNNAGVLEGEQTLSTNFAVSSLLAPL